ncbi:MAG TPA: RraA family protein [Chthonomonadales bacterium]|nr:RraA family protein [Chthonomonadales bacterium]
MVNTVDPFALRKRYEPLRVVDVCDALDGIGRFSIGLMDPAVRPLWPGMRFWGPALTVRCVPANRPMWPLSTTEEIVDAHGVWFREVGSVPFEDRIRPGHVVVTDTGGAGEVGFWGSCNALFAVAAGAVGIVTDGYCRDTAELAQQRTPICSRARGRTIIPGRIQVVEVDAPIGCGGAQVRPGDIVGCDDDGVVVVPLEVADEVATHARAILLADMRARRALYDRLGREPDATVDVEATEAWFARIDAGR